jgi:hypothetical protein
MKRYILSLLLVLATIASSAQQKQKRFYLIPQAGVLSGDHIYSGQWQLVGGLQKKQWAFGLGCGMDYYKLRSIPVFTDTRYFFGKKNACFSYLNLGYNIASPMPWQKKMAYYYWPSTKGDSRFDNGMYTDIGLGYILNVTARKKVMLSVGYGFKTVTERYNTWMPWIDFRQVGNSIVMQKPDYDQSVDYWLNYFSLKLGINLW